MKATFRTKKSSGRKPWLLAGLAAAGGAALLARRARQATSPDPDWFAVTVRTDPDALTGPDRPDQLARLAERHEIRITTAPGGRGAELAVRAADGDTRQEVRAIKQLLETGEVLLVEGQPEGRRTLLGRTAQPALRQLSRKGTR